MAGKTSLDKFHDFLFKEKPDNIKLSEREQKALVRYRATFTLQLDNPSVTEKEIKNFLVNNYGVSRSQAYEDIRAMKTILGSIENATKNWIRYIVIQTLLSAIEKAKTLPPRQGLKLIIRACGTLGRISRLDKEDGFDMPWDEIVPQSIEPTSDPTVLNVRPIPNRDQYIKELYQKYCEDIEIE